MYVRSVRSFYSTCRGRTRNHNIFPSNVKNYCIIFLIYIIFFFTHLFNFELIFVQRSNTNIYNSLPAHAISCLKPIIRVFIYTTQI